MRREIEISAIREAIEFLAAERKIELEMDSALRIVRALAIGHFELVFCRTVDSGRVDIAMDCRAPLFKTLLPLVRAHEIFDLHLFELAHAENEVARRNLVPECLPY